eukprot:364952-Chlamydomonas_euryale.AAC.1
MVATAPADNPAPSKRPHSCIEFQTVNILTQEKTGLQPCGHVTWCRKNAPGYQCNSFTAERLWLRVGSVCVWGGGRGGDNHWEYVCAGGLTSGRAIPGQHNRLGEQFQDSTIHMIYELIARGFAPLQGREPVHKEGMMLPLTLQLRQSRQNCDAGGGSHGVAQQPQLSRHGQPVVPARHHHQPHAASRVRARLGRACILDRRHGFAHAAGESQPGGGRCTAALATAAAGITFVAAAGKAAAVYEPPKESFGRCHRNHIVV